MQAESITSVICIALTLGRTILKVNTVDNGYHVCCNHDHHAHPDSLPLICCHGFGDNFCLGSPSFCILGDLCVHGCHGTSEYRILSPHPYKGEMK